MRIEGSRHSGRCSLHDRAQQLVSPTSSAPAMAVVPGHMRSATPSFGGRLGSLPRSRSRTATRFRVADAVLRALGAAPASRRSRARGRRCRGAPRSPTSGPRRGWTRRRRRTSPRRRARARAPGRRPRSASRGRRAGRSPARRRPARRPAASMSAISSVAARAVGHVGVGDLGVQGRDRPTGRSGRPVRRTRRRRRARPPAPSGGRRLGRAQGHDATARSWATAAAIDANTCASAPLSASSAARTSWCWSFSSERSSRARAVSTLPVTLPPSPSSGWLSSSRCARCRADRRRASGRSAGPRRRSRAPTTTRS